MKHKALVAAVAIFIAVSSCATEKDLPPASDPLAKPEEADKAIVCRFGSVHDGDTDQKKGCTTPTDRREEKPPRANSTGVGSAEADR
jgi:hypothetical protein